MIKTTDMRAIQINSGIQNGESTHTHDQWMIPNSLRTMKSTVSVENVDSVAIYILKVI